MIVAVRLDDRGRCSFDCICVRMNTLLLVARAAWHMIFRRHCCRLDRKARKSQFHRRAGQDQSTRTSARAPVDHKTKQRSHRSDRIMNSGLLYHPPGTNDDKQKQHTARSPPAADRNAPCQYPAQRAESYWDDRGICTCCFGLFSMQINAGWARWGDTRGRGGQRGNELHEP